MQQNQMENEVSKIVPSYRWNKANDSAFKY